MSKISDLLKNAAAQAAALKAAQVTANRDILGAQTGEHKNGDKRSNGDVWWNGSWNTYMDYQRQIALPLNKPLPNQLPTTIKQGGGLIESGINSVSGNLPTVYALDNAVFATTATIAIGAATAGVGGLLTGSKTIDTIKEIGAETKDATKELKQTADAIVPKIPIPLAPPPDYLSQIRADVAGITALTPAGGGAGAAPATRELDLLEKFFAWLAGVIKG